MPLEKAAPQKIFEAQLELTHKLPNDNVIGRLYVYVHINQRFIGHTLEFSVMAKHTKVENCHSILYQPSSDCIFSLLVSMFMQEWTRESMQLTYTVWPLRCAQVASQIV